MTINNNLNQVGLQINEQDVGSTSSVDANQKNAELGDVKLSQSSNPPRVDAGHLDQPHADSFQSMVGNVQNHPAPQEPRIDSGKDEWVRLEKADFDSVAQGKAVVGNLTNGKLPKDFQMDMDRAVKVLLERYGYPEKAVADRHGHLNLSKLPGNAKQLVKDMQAELKGYDLIDRKLFQTVLRDKIETHLQTQAKQDNLATLTRAFSEPTGKVAETLLDIASRLETKYGLTDLVMPFDLPNVDKAEQLLRHKLEQCPDRVDEATFCALLDNAAEEAMMDKLAEQIEQDPKLWTDDQSVGGAVAKKVLDGMKSEFFKGESFDVNILKKDLSLLEKHKYLNELNAMDRELRNAFEKDSYARSDETAAALLQHQVKCGYFARLLSEMLPTTPMNDREIFTIIRHPEIDALIQNSTSAADMRARFEAYRATLPEKLATLRFVQKMTDTYITMAKDKMQQMLGEELPWMNPEQRLALRKDFESRLFMVQLSAKTLAFDKKLPSMEKEINAYITEALDKHVGRVKAAIQSVKDLKVPEKSEHRMMQQVLSENVRDNQLFGKLSALGKRIASQFPSPETSQLMNEAAFKAMNEEQQVKFLSDLAMATTYEVNANLRELSIEGAEELILALTESLRLGLLSHGIDMMEIPDKVLEKLEASIEGNIGKSDFKNSKEEELSNLAGQISGWVHFVQNEKTSELAAQA